MYAAAVTQVPDPVVAVNDPVDEGVNEYHQLLAIGLGAQLGVGSPASVVAARALSVSPNGRAAGEITDAFAKSSSAGGGTKLTFRCSMPPLVQQLLPACT